MPEARKGFTRSEKGKKIGPLALYAAAALGIDQKRKNGQALACESRIATPEGPCTAWTLIDSGAEKSFVNQKWAKQHLLDTETLPMPVHAMDGHAVNSFGSRELEIELIDCRGIVRQHDLQCEAVVMSGYDLILGFDWLKIANPDVDWEQTRWYYRSATASGRVEEITAAACVREIFTGSATHILYPQLVSGDGAAFSVAMSSSNDLPEAYTDYADIFDVKDAGLLPDHTPHDHAIDLKPGEEIPHRPIYKLSAKELGVLREYLDMMLEKGWIQPSTSPAGAPILFVPKKDGSLRLCVDYRGLNNLTIKNRYPLPLIGETMDRLAGATIYTQLDLRDAYHRIRIRKGDEWKTAFRTRYGHFEYTVMPFGLANAPATFQSYINRALSDLLDICCVVYLDDILIYSNSEREHIRHVRRVLDRLRRYGLYCKRSKCAFHTQQVNFLGFIISPQGTQMEPERVKTITEWPEPRCVYDVQQFLGFANFYRKFIEGYSKIVAPMTELTKGNGTKKGGANRKTDSFVFTREARVAFQDLKQHFATAPLLAHFDPDLQTRIEVDASGFAVAGVATQSHDGRWHPIAFWSRKMIGAETRYETHDAELLSIVESFKHWRHYLEGSRFPVVVLSDHANLRYFMTTKELTRRQARWAERLAAYDFVIEHRPGAKNPADAPSRRPDYAPAKGEFAKNSLLPVLQEQLRRSLSKDAEQTSKITGALAAQVHVTLIPLNSDYEDSHCGISIPVDEYRTDGDTGVPDILVPRRVARAAMAGETAYATELKESMIEFLRKVQSGNAETREVLRRIETKGEDSKLSGTPWSTMPDGLLRYEDRVWVPQIPAVTQEIIRTNHDDPQGGHFREKRTLNAIRRRYYWRGMAGDIRKYCQECDSCQQNAVPRHKPYGLLDPLPVPAGPGDWMSIDFITGLPPSRWQGKVYDAVLVAVDLYTKFAIYVPCTKDIDAPALADLFLIRIIPYLGMPANLVSDRGSLFTCEFWSSFCYLMATKRRLSTAYHPQTDGQTERQNQTLEYYLRSYVNWQQDDWARWLPMAQVAHNQSWHSAIKMTPHEALTGTNLDLRMNVSAVDLNQHHDARTRVLGIHQMRKNLEQRLREAKDAMAKYANRKRTEKSFKVGDWVLLRTRNLDSGRPSKKLDHKAIGPFMITDAIGKQAYRLRLTPQYRRMHPTFHVSMLEPYYGSPRSAATAPSPIEVDGQEEWEIDCILDHRQQVKGMKYLVKWKGYPDTENTWEPRENVEETEALDRYENQLRGRSKTTRIGKRRRRQ